MNIFRLPGWLFFSTCFLFIVGFISRIAPIFDHGGRLLQQFPTEDGYMMLTVSRNIALGYGMSTSDGTIPTNGVQPLATYLWSLGYWFSNGDKIIGVVVAHVIQLALSVSIVFAMYHLAKKAFLKNPYQREIALVLAGLFFASPHVLPHTMNYLETSLYLLTIIIVIILFLEPQNSGTSAWNTHKSILVGLILGLLFWARVDSVFIILAVCIGYLYGGLNGGRTILIKRFRSVLVFGTMSVIIASPWLLNNYRGFGSIIPVSGRSEGIASFGQNIIAIPSAVLEYLMIALPIPSAIQEEPAVATIATFVLLVACFCVWFLWKKVEHNLRTIIVIGMIVAICFITYYGLFFGATHFVSRYMIVLAPFLSLLTASVFVFLFNPQKSLHRIAASTCFVVLVLLTVLLNIRIYSNGIPHQHFQVINWVKENVSENAWIGAVQTGTLGYFHDRTLNLDGKVNPEALKSRLGEKYCGQTRSPSEKINGVCLIDYIVEKNISHLVDWVGIEAWLEISPMSEYYELAKLDRDKNLAVLRRKKL